MVESQEMLSKLNPFANRCTILPYKYDFSVSSKWQISTRFAIQFSYPYNDEPNDEFVIVFYNAA